MGSKLLLRMNDCQSRQLEESFFLSEATSEMDWGTRASKTSNNTHYLENDFYSQKSFHLLAEGRNYQWVVIKWGKHGKQEDPCSPSPRQAVPLPYGHCNYF